MPNLFDEKMREVLERTLTITTQVAYEITDASDPWNSLEKQFYCENTIGNSGYYEALDPGKAREKFLAEFVWPEKASLEEAAYYSAVKAFAERENLATYVTKESAIVYMRKKQAAQLGRDFFFVSLKESNSYQMTLPLHEHVARHDVLAKNPKLQAYAFAQRTDKDWRFNDVVEASKELKTQSVCFIRETPASSKDEFVRFRLMARWIPFTGCLPCLFGVSWEEPPEQAQSGKSSKTAKGAKSSKRKDPEAEAMEPIRDVRFTERHYISSMSTIQVGDRLVYRKAVEWAINILGCPSTLYYHPGGYEDWERLRNLMSFWGDGYQMALDDVKPMLRHEFKDKEHDLAERTLNVINEAKKIAKT